MAARGTQRKSTTGGFTLLEVLLAMVMFAFITFALSLALSSALQAQQVVQRHQDEAGAVRAVFGTLNSDLQAAYASTGNPSAIFVVGGASNSGTAAPGSLLTLTTLARRIQADDMTADAAMPQPPQSQPVPQADYEIVRYDLDTSAGTLTRMVSPVPNPQMLAQTSPTPDTVLAQNVLAFKLSFWDSGSNSWQDTWDYESQTQSQSGTQSTQTGTTTTGSTSTGTSTSSTSTNTYLPTVAQVTLILQLSDGTPATYTTMIPIISPTPQTSATTTTTTTGSGTQGQATGSASTGAQP